MRHSAMRQFRHTGRCVSMVCIVLMTDLLYPNMSVVHAASPSFETSIDYTMHKLATEHNDPSAQYLVGRNFLKGKSVERNVKEAIKWFEMAAKQNHIRAQYQLGKLYLYGDGIKQSLNYAYYYLSKAAERNHLESLYELGNYYLIGDSNKRQYGKAIKWFRKAATREHVKAQYELGKLIYEGKGTESNPTEGKIYIKLAAESGLLKATDYLADIENGNLAGKDDSTVAKNSYNNSLINGTNFENSNNSNEAETDSSISIPVTVKESDSTETEAINSPDEQYKLGIKYLTGKNSIKNINKAAEYFIKAANGDHGKAQYQLAKLYKQGIGVEQDKALYQEWLTKAAEAGVQNAKRDLDAINIEKSLDHKIDENTTDPQAQYLLGLRYYNGDRKNTDHMEAAKWFLKAAQQSHSKSQLQLGIMYEKGIGFNQDINKARRWYKMAADSGMQEAKLALRELKKQEFQDNNNKIVSTKLSMTSANNKTPNKIKPKQVSVSTIKIDPNDPLEKQLISLKSKPIYPLIRNATKGDKKAQFEVGLKYLAGEDGLNRNVKKALKWIKVAANNEHTEARLKLGMLYLNGIDVEKNYRTAAQWLEKAAYAGSPDAQLALGDLYKEGLGVEQNSTTAIMWYRKSANQGHNEARKRLGGCRIC